jgi:asparagine synthase (glutamine-hydrolysing)
MAGGPISADVLKRMTAVLIHRGPDDQGIFIEDNVGLGHRRLNIIDLETGRQPLFNEDGRLALVFNGEIYNYRELRRGLLDRGHAFSTKTDTEVVLHLYEEKGERCLDDLRGMFAFALWDAVKKELFFARDRLGKKPFYYYTDGCRFIFASEIKAILEYPLSLSVDRDAVIDFFKYQFIPSPRTIYQEIRKLPPAHFGKIGPKGLTLGRYWDIPVRRGALGQRSLSSLQEELDSLIAEATKLRLVSDVPLGAFLSGGLDSSLIAAFMKKSSASEVKTFSIGFKERSYDESVYAEQVARTLQTTHKTHIVEYNILDDLSAIVGQFDEPFGDSSAIPTFYLTKYTRENVTVALSGDGGDELFGGYRRYIAHKMGKFYLAVPGAIRRTMVEPVVRRLSVKAGYYGKSLPKKLKLFVNAAHRIETGRFYLPQIFSDEEAKGIFSGDFLDLREHAYEDYLYSEFLNDTGFDDLTRLMWFDLHHYLPDDILVKVDRMSMLNSLEVRAPYLDQSLVEFAFNLPLEFKIRRMTGKYILKKIGREYLPREIVNRKKQGFAVPLDSWFMSALNPIFAERVLHNNKIFNRSAVEKIYQSHVSRREDNSVKMWLLLVFAMFHESHLKPQR